MLTPRQKQVAELVARGWRPTQIAQRLGVTPKTVEVYMQRAADRLGGDPGPGPRHKLTIWFLGQHHNSAA